MKKTDYEIYLSDYEIFLSFSKRPKKYIVATRKLSAVNVVAMKYYCKRFFKCSEKHIKITLAYINNDELYFENPEKSGTRMVYVGYYVR